MDVMDVITHLFNARHCFDRVILHASVFSRKLKNNVRISTPSK